MHINPQPAGVEWMSWKWREKNRGYGNKYSGSHSSDHQLVNLGKFLVSLSLCLLICKMQRNHLFYKVVKRKWNNEGTQEAVTIIIVPVESIPDSRDENHHRTVWFSCLSMRCYSVWHKVIDWPSEGWAALCNCPQRWALFYWSLRLFKERHYSQQWNACQLFYLWCLFGWQGWPASGPLGEAFGPLHVITPQCGEKTAQLGKLHPNRWASGTPSCPGGTACRGSWVARRKSRHHPAPYWSAPLACEIAPWWKGNLQWFRTSDH